MNEVLGRFNDGTLNPNGARIFSIDFWNMGEPIKITYNSEPKEYTPRQVIDALFYHRYTEGMQPQDEGWLEELVGAATRYRFKGTVVSD